MDNSTLIIVAAAVVAFLVVKKIQSVPRTPPAEVAAKIKAGARIVDVRTPQEYGAGSYKKSRNIPVDALAGRLGELEPRDKPIVVYCASGARSSQAARILKKAGFTDVSNAGGLSEMPR